MNSLSTLVICRQLDIGIEAFSKSLPSIESIHDCASSDLPPADSKVWKHVYKYSPLQVQIKYTLKNPEVGIYFRENPTPHIFSWSNFFSGKQEETLGNGTRTWIPCIDNDLERCLWELEILVPPNYSVRAMGDLVQTQKWEWSLFLVLVSITTI